MRTKLACLILMAILCNPTQGQTITKEISPNVVQFKKKVYLGSTTYETFTNPANLSIGNVLEWSNTKWYLRAVYKFDFSEISLGAQISKIEYNLQMTVNSTGSSSEEKKINVSFKAADESNYTTEIDDATEWSALENGDEYFNKEIDNNINAITEVTSSEDLYDVVEGAIRNGTIIYISVVSDEEDSFWSVYNSTHKIWISQVSEILNSFKFKITYDEDYLITFKTDYGYADPAGVDFKVDGTNRQHGYEETWSATSTHILEGVSHENITLTVLDGEQYDLVPDGWFRDTKDEQHGTDWVNSYYYWPDATADWDADMIAVHNRYVKYQLFATKYGTLENLSNIAINRNNQAYSQGEIHSKLYSNWLDVEFDAPLRYYDVDEKALYCFVDLIGDENAMAVDDVNNNVEASLSPEYNQILGSRMGPYRFLYQKIQLNCVDNNADICSMVMPNVSYSSLTAMSITHPYSFDKAGVRYFFWKWMDGDVSGIDKIGNVVIKAIEPNNGNLNYSDAMTGIYKAHMISGSAFSSQEPICGVCPGSQRKIVWMPEQFGVNYLPLGIYQAVYESADETIWYTYSLDGGVSWEDELFIDHGSSPSIAHDQDRTYILYRNSPYDYTFTYKELVPGMVTSTTYVDASFILNGNPDAAPVIEVDAAQNLELIIWQGNSGELDYAIYHSHACVEFGFLNSSGVPNGIAETPTISHREGSSLYHIAWREGTSVYYLNFDITADASTYYYKTQSPITLLSNGYHFAHGYPSITVDGSDYPCIAWSSFDIGMGNFISFRQNSSNGWGPAATFISLPYHQYWAPSVSVVDNKPSGDDIRIAHNDGVNSVVVQRMSGGYWLLPGFVQGIEGMYPSVCKYAQDGSNLEIYCAPTNIPTPTVKKIEITSEHLNKINYKRQEVSREVAVSNQDGISRVLISDVRLVQNGSVDQIAWKNSSKEAIVLDDESVSQFVKTLAFTPSFGSTLRFKLMKKMHDVYNGIATIKFELVDSLSGNVVFLIDSIRLADSDTIFSVLNVITPVSQYADKRILMRAVLSVNDTSNHISATEYFYDNLETLEKNIVKHDSYLGEVDECEIQVYPNPCDRVANIAIRVPSERNIALYVTDLVGNVKLHVSNMMLQKGEFEYKFDTSNLPAGKYLLVAEYPGSKQSKVLHIVR
jgi:hypothetical protein